MPRIPLPSPETMTPEQRKVYDSIVTGPRGTLVGPLRAALHQPELAEKWQQFGELLRFRTSLVTAAQRARDPGHGAALVLPGRMVHSRARRGRTGVVPAVIIEIRGLQAPPAWPTRHATVYDYARRTDATGKVSEPTYRGGAEAAGRRRHCRTDRADRLLHHGGDDAQRPRNSVAGRRRAAAAGTVN